MPPLFDLPLLPSLEELLIVSCNGLNKWNEFPTLSSQELKISLKNNGLIEEAVGRILEWILRGMWNRALKKRFLQSFVSFGFFVFLKLVLKIITQKHFIMFFLKFLFRYTWKSGYRSFTQQFNTL